MRVVPALGVLFASWAGIANGGDLQRRPVYDFSVGEIRGIVRPHGAFHGLLIYHPLLTRTSHEESTSTADRSARVLLNLEHYVARGLAGGQFLPRRDALQSSRLGENSLTISFKPAGTWLVRGEIRYDFSSDSYIDAVFSFEFGADFRDFEAFVASYMPSEVPPLVKTGGRWRQIYPPHGVHLILLRESRLADLIEDGRWDWLPDWIEMQSLDGVYDLPALVAWDRTTGYAVIQFADPRECMAVSFNTFAPAHDLSLIGHDVKKGQMIRVPVRIHFKRITSLDVVERLYRRFCKDHDIPCADDGSARSTAGGALVAP